jgi:ubiquinone/menaquinone biosynthesis C-methylase UbiE
MSSSNFSDDEKKAQVKAYFSRTAANYVSSTSHRTGSDLQRLIALGDFTADQHVLDIATGGGHTALAVAPLVHEITVTDLTPTMLEQAQTFLLSQHISNAHFAIADAERLPFTSASFERVTCRIAPHHFINVALSVYEVARVLKAEGIFLLIDSCAPANAELDTFANTAEKWRDSSHGRSYSVKEWHDFFDQANLHVEEQELFRKTHSYDDWTQRSQMDTVEKLALEQFILNSSSQTRTYFEVTTKPDGHIDHFSFDYLLLKGRKR